MRERERGRVRIGVDKSGSSHFHSQSTDQVPTIQQLHELQGKDGKTVRIIDTVAPEWEELAIAMGFPAHMISTIRRDNLRDAKGATLQVLTLWLKGSSSVSVSWAVLLGCLQQADFSNITLDLQEMLSS